MGAVLDAALRSRGFTIAADDLNAALTVTYVFDRLDEGLWYSRLSVSDGLTVTRTWRQSGDNLIADSGSAQTTMQDEMTSAALAQLGQTSLELLQKNLTLSPTLKIRPGFLFNIMVTKDMAFGGPYAAR